MKPRHLIFVLIIAILVFLVGCADTKPAVTQPPSQSQQIQTDQPADKQAVTQPQQPETKQPTVTPPQTPTQPPTVTPAPPAQTQKNEVTVYVTKTGAKYHRAGCQYLSKSKISMSLSEAKDSGYGPCSKCNPPI